MHRRVPCLTGKAPTLERGRAVWAFVAGMAPGLAAIRFHTSIVWDTDSARLLASLIYVRRHGVGHLLDTQEVLLPHVLLAPLIEVGGIAAAHVIAVVALPVLSGLIGFLAWQLTRSWMGVVGSSLGLVSFGILMSQTTSIRMYLTMLVFGYLGVWLAFRSIEADSARLRWLFAGFGALCLAASQEAHGVGQLFLIVPVILLILRPSRVAIRRLIRLYFFLAVVLIPRLLINFAEGGLAYFRSNRTDYFVTNGYLSAINTEFWGHPIAGSRTQYLSSIFDSTVSVVGWSSLAVLVLVGMSLIGGRSHRSALFGLACVGLLVIALIISRPPPFSRYFSPLLPGAALAASAGLAKLTHTNRIGRFLSWLLLVGVAAGAIGSFAHNLEEFEDGTAFIQQGPFFGLASAIDDDRHVIGVRSSDINFVRADVETYGTMFLTEEEFVTYLTWPSDKEVVELMERYDIGWVFVGPLRELEVDYHEVWVVPNYRRRVRHVDEIEASPRFCLAFEDSGYKLYRLGACGPRT